LDNCRGRGEIEVYLLTEVGQLGVSCKLIFFWLFLDETPPDVAHHTVHTGILELPETLLQRRNPPLVEVEGKHNLCESQCEHPQI